MTNTLPMPRMVAELQAILEAELALGNTIREVAEWPPKCRLFVGLALPFRTRHLHPASVTYEPINDAHYWKAEYRYRDGLEVLVCPF